MLLITRGITAHTTILTRSSLCKSITTPSLPFVRNTGCIVSSPKVLAQLSTTTQMSHEPQTKSQTPADGIENLIIIGSGPAAHTAAIYAAR